jgi:hypothetical protein
MAGPSGRACGPPKGMLGPATHDLPASDTVNARIRGFLGCRRTFHASANVKQLFWLIWRRLLAWRCVIAWGQNRRVRPWRQKRENAKAPSNPKKLCLLQRHCALACRYVSVRPPMYQHAHDLGVSWRLGVSALLLAVIEGCGQAVMRQPPPSTTQPLFGRRHVTPRSAFSMLGRGQQKARY